MVLSPKNKGFNIKIGPKAEIFLESSSCENIESLRDDFLKWRERLDNQSKEVASCQCGKRNIEKETYDYFKKELMSEYDVGRFQFFRRWQMGRAMNKTCYMDITNALPDQVAEMTKKQLIKDHHNKYFNALYEHHGVNCFSAAMVGGDILGENRFVSQSEFRNFIKSPFCKVVEYEDLIPGDFIVLYSDHPADGDKKPVHVSTYVNESLVFEKKGGHKDFPFQFAPASESFRIHGKKGEYFRCENFKEMKEKFVNIEAFLEVEKDLRNIESCLSTIYNHDRKGSEFWAIADLVKNSLDPIVDLVHDKYMDTYTDDRTGILPGKELENKYWFILKQQIISMQEQVNTNLKWVSPLQLENDLAGR